MSNEEIKSQQIGITTSFEPFKNVEWAFQFNNDEPIKFAEPNEFNTDKGLMMAKEMSLNFLQEKG